MPPARFLAVLKVPNWCAVLGTIRLGFLTKELSGDADFGRVGGRLSPLLSGRSSVSPGRSESDQSTSCGFSHRCLRPVADMVCRRGPTCEARSARIERIVRARMKTRLRDFVAPAHTLARIPA